MTGKEIKNVTASVLAKLRSLASGESLTKQWKAGQGWWRCEGSSRALLQGVYQRSRQQ